MIAVYPYKIDGDGFELRYSLRSLANIKDVEGVLLVGDKPDWYRGPYINSDNSGPRLKNVQGHLRYACKELRDTPWYLMNDDFFVLNDYDSFPVVRGASMVDFTLKTIGLFRLRARETMKIVGPHSRSFQVHCPLPVDNSLLMVETVDMCEGKLLHRTIYSWLRGLENSWKLESSDSYVFSDESLQEAVARGAWFSTGPAYGRSPVFRRQMEALFPEPSPWENDA